MTTSPSLAEIRAAILAVLEQVPDIGRLHAYERYSREKSRLLDLYAWPPTVPVGQSRPLRGWYVRRLTSGSGSGSTSGDWVSHQWQIRGFMSFDDATASELAFDDLIELVRAALETNRTLGGTIFDLVGGEQGELQRGVRLVDSGPVMFADVLCHGADLRFFTRHYNTEDEE